MNNRKIFLSITTTENSDWRKKIEEVKKLGLKEVCLFLTCLGIKERKELYRLLEKTKIEKIPLVHLRSDMKTGELDYLAENYRTKAFNIHSLLQYPLKYNLEKYRDVIFIENTRAPFLEEEIKKFAGPCLDISHLENDFYGRPEIYGNNVKIAEKYPCGCNHISPVRKEFLENRSRYYNDNDLKVHLFKNLSDFDYLRKYPAKYFSKIIALELENSIEEQLRAKDYIVELLKDKFAVDKSG